MIWEILVLGIILIISIIYEIIYMEISPWLWIIGGIIGIIFSALGMGVISVLEGILCAIIFYILIFITKMYYGIGGGILKGLIMCACYLGRYFVITFVIATILLFMISKLKKPKICDDFPGGTLVMGTPIIAVAMAFTIIILYMMGVLQ